jgi:hypothetical protein
VAELDPAPLSYETRTLDGRHWICRCNRRADADLHAASPDLYASLRDVLERHGDKCRACNAARRALTKALGG